MNKMTTLIGRELIEHRSSWIVPAVFGALFVLAAILSIFGIVRIGGTEGGMTLAEIGEHVSDADIYPALLILFMPIAMVMAGVMSFVVFFYYLDALYADRKDRSILFWKSLPVSDLRVVASKYVTGVAAIPALTVVAFVVTAVLVWLIGGLTLLAAGTSQALASGPAALARVTAMLVYLLVTQAVWFMPLHGWLLLVSAFAKRAVLGWALLPPVLLMVAERTLLGTSHFADLLGHRMSGGFELAFSGDHHRIMAESDGSLNAVVPALGELFTPGRFLAAPSLWAGIAVGLLFLAGAVWLRRWRDES